MDASQYLRRLKESCTQTLGRPKAIDASLRTQIVRNAATSTYVPPTQSKVQTGLTPTNECCLKPQPGFDGAVTPILPPAGCISQAACNDMENRYAEPITIPGCPIPYMSSTYVQANSYKYQGTREQTAEAERLRNCKDSTRPLPPPTQGCLSFNKGILRTPVVNGFSLSSTDAFTVEWFQKLAPITFETGDRREYYYTIFSIGDLNNEDNPESMAFYYQVSPPDPISEYSVKCSAGNTRLNFGNFGSSGPQDYRQVGEIEDTWIHVALVGNVATENTITLYVDGAKFGSAYNYNDCSISGQPYLTIGGKSPLDPRYYYNGCLTNFRFTKGEALYTASEGEPFTPPTAPLTARPTTQLLLKTMSDFPANDSSTPQKPITPIGPVAFSADSPF